MSVFGTVKWFNDAKGFGFIQPEGGGDDVFAHHTCIRMNGFRTLKQGARVVYELIEGKKGPAAQNIQMLDANGQPIEPESSEHTESEAEPRR